MKLMLLIIYLLIIEFFETWLEKLLDVLIEGYLATLRASPAVLHKWSCTVKLDELKSKCAGLAQENHFGWA
jgi:hypothetical protein